MKALYSLILASGTKEALFAALWLALDEAPGTFADVDFASLRTTAARFGVALSESQVRKRVKELEKLDVLAVAPRRERGRFDLLVYQPAPNRFNVDATAPKPEPATPLFDAAFGKGVESFADRDRAVPGPRFRANLVSAPVGRDALAQLRADAASVADAVSETETKTKTATETDATSQTAPSKAERADALLARSPFAEALRRAIWPKDYEAIAWNVRCYRFPPDGFSDDEHDAMDSRVCELYAESRRIADEFDARAQRGEYADAGGSERCDAEREAALRAFAATRNPAIAPTVAEVRAETSNRFAIDREQAPKPSAADHFREAAKMIQTPTFAEVRDVRPASTFPSTLAVAPESSESEPVAAPLEEINIKNKTINKPAKVFNRETQAGPEARSVADVRSLVDFESPKVAAFRRLVARNVWERTIHPDLIDRIVALAVLRVGGTDAKAVESMIRDAKAEVALWNRTDGRRGQPQIWRAITPEVKRLYENAGWVWLPTRFATEPRPEPRRVAETVDA